MGGGRSALGFSAYPEVPSVLNSGGLGRRSIMSAIDGNIYHVKLAYSAYTISISTTYFLYI